MISFPPPPPARVWLLLLLLLAGAHHTTVSDEAVRERSAGGSIARGRCTPLLSLPSASLLEEELRLLVLLLLLSGLNSFPNLSSEPRIETLLAALSELMGSWYSGAITREEDGEEFEFILPLLPLLPRPRPRPRRLDDEPPDLPFSLDGDDFVDEVPSSDSFLSLRIFFA